VTVALPNAHADVERPGEGHEWLELETDVEGYRASGLPAKTMGRTLDEDPPFFAAALAAGSALAQKVGVAR
jgi:hypothetical protein